MFHCVHQPVANCFCGPSVAEQAVHSGFSELWLTMMNLQRVIIHICGSARFYGLLYVVSFSSLFTGTADARDAGKGARLQTKLKQFSDFFHSRRITKRLTGLVRKAKTGGMSPERQTSPMGSRQIERTQGRQTKTSNLDQEHWRNTTYCRLTLLTKRGGNKAIYIYIQWELINYEKQKNRGKQYEKTKAGSKNSSSFQQNVPVLEVLHS